MSFQFFCSLLWVNFLVILLHIGGNQSSSTAQVYDSETLDIIKYGVSVFRTIIKHQEQDGNLITALNNIKIENRRVQQLMFQDASALLNMFSCKPESGLESCNNLLKYFDQEYGAFVNYHLNINNSHIKFPPDITSMHESGVWAPFMQTGLQWIDMKHRPSHQELFEALVERYDPMVERNCSDFSSLNQYLYLLYNKILLGLIKAYSIIIYSHTKAAVQMGNSIGTPNLSHVIDGFQSKVVELSNNVLKAMNNESSRYIARRDPSSHRKGITYDSLDYFIQGYVTVMSFLNRDESCTPTCSDYNDTVHYDHRSLPPKSICTGRIRACADSSVQIMFIAGPDSTRRYEGLGQRASSFGGMKYYGRQPKYNDPFSVALYSKLCKICACTCDMVDAPLSIRYVDLRPRTSRSFDYFFVTGIRFRIINRILYIQIQEGELRNGQILAETVTWNQFEDINRDHDNDFELFKLGYDNRLFDLTDLTLPDNNAITMVGFTVINGVVGLKIRGRLMSGGRYNGPVYHRLSNQSAQLTSSRPLFKPDGLDVPTMENIKNRKISEPNKYLVKFETSDWANDVGQNVVPFIDLQDVVTNPPAPVAGIGIHVRYGGTSGGFLAPKLLSVNDGMNIRLEDIKEKILSLRPDVEMEIESRDAIIRETTPIPPKVSTISRPKPVEVTVHRSVPHFFIANKG